MFMPSPVLESSRQMPSNDNILLGELLCIRLADVHWRTIRLQGVDPQESAWPR